MAFHELTLLAYIDPGTGAIILQAALAALFGASIVFRRIFYTLFSPLTRMFRRNDDSVAEEPVVTDDPPNE